MAVFYTAALRPRQVRERRRQKVGPKPQSVLRLRLTPAEDGAYRPSGQNLANGHFICELSDVPTTHLQTWQWLPAKHNYICMISLFCEALEMVGLSGRDEGNGLLGKSILEGIQASLRGSGFW